ncbi:MAG: T9SS type A sorting domain-containing protein [Candidatus Cloacimonadales bacterium]|nr:T9SS type A sorting domain-containing protein [Candidatus Cloacimonadales bacterium]
MDYLQNKKIWYFVLLISLFCFSLPAQQVSFSEPLPISGEAIHLGEIECIDFDGDGDKDIISASQYDDKLGWHENLDGMGTFSTRQIITTELWSPSLIHAVDIDNDQDLDIVSYASYDYDIAWFENLDGSGNFGQMQIITYNLYQTYMITDADIDGDGDQDIIAQSFHRLSWYENLDGLGDFGEERNIIANPFGNWNIDIKDFDQDGDLDIVEFYYRNDEENHVCWHENLDGLGNFSFHQDFIFGFDNKHDLVCFDIDADGNMDILLADLSINNPSISWFKNLGGTMNFSQEILITDDIGHIWNMFTKDYDFDGDLDVIVQTDDGTFWLEHINDSANFGEKEFLLNAGSSFQLEDIDSDSDLDAIFIAGWDEIAWSENLFDQSCFAPIQILTTGGGLNFFTDIDSDGDIDGVCGSMYGIYWLENTNGQGLFTPQQLKYWIDFDNWNTYLIYANDIDNDGDNDVVAATNSHIFWYANLDGEGNFGSSQTIISDIGHNKNLVCIDMDGDNDQDILYVERLNSINYYIVWLENTDGLGTYSPEQVILSEIYEITWFECSDLDGDNDLDIAAAILGDNKIVWIENLDGQGNFGQQQLISNEVLNPRNVICFDLDNDNDIDVISSSSADDLITWYENLNNSGEFGNQQIISDSLGGCYLQQADLDGDGDQDIITSYLNRILWLENLDQNGNFNVSEIIIEPYSQRHLISCTDLNNDNKVDIVFADNQMVNWLRNDGTTSISPWEDPQSIPVSETFLKNYPNPFNPETTISFNLNQPENVELKVYNIAGQFVRNLIEEELPAGNHSINFESNGLASGIYFLKLKAGDLTEERKILLLK